MAADSGYSKKTCSNPLNEFVDFGPDAATESVAATSAPAEVTNRLKHIVQAIQEISRRIDRLVDPD